MLGVMGCPNWVVDATYKSTTHAQSYSNSSAGLGVIMVAHVGCGTWKKRLKNMLNSSTKISSDWTRCFVDGFCLVSNARFCIPESQTWESLPLSVLYKARIDDDNVGDKEICLLSAFCGRFGVFPGYFFCFLSCIIFNSIFTSLLSKLQYFFSVIYLLPFLLDFLF